MIAPPAGRRHQRAKALRWSVPLAAAALGALFFVWIAGTRVLIPTETAWAVQGDWRVHFLGWQFFRHEPWHLPPGRIDRYFEPLGTAIGVTDSIPLAAFALKPFARWLPQSFQYLGPWLALCFALQGAFGARLMRLWTAHPAHQLLGAACFVLVPTLLMRTPHPALCAHWLVLWAIWLYLRVDGAERPMVAQSTTLALTAAMIHPYLAIMVLALLSALTVRLLHVGAIPALVTFVTAAGATLFGWWLSGMFTLTRASVLGAGGLRDYSMNLLAPITPTGWSALLPEIPTAAHGQLWEGFQYLGAGLLLLLIAAVAASLMRLVPSGTPESHPSAGAALGTPAKGALHPVRVFWPLAVAVTVLAIYSLSPRVTFGGGVVLEVTGAWLDRFSMFRATGRFFWPAGYLLLAMALARLASRPAPPVATAVLCAAIVIQFVDLHDAYSSRRDAWRAEQLLEWRPSLQSPLWDQVLPHYSHLVTYPPNYRGAQSVDVETLSYLAGRHGLSLNAGLVARFDESRRREACDRLVQTLLAGDVDDASLYIGRPGEIDLLKGRARRPLVCGVIDTVTVCATAKSYETWRGVARLE